MQQDVQSKLVKNAFLGKLNKNVNFGLSLTGRHSLKFCPTEACHTSKESSNLAL